MKKIRLLPIFSLLLLFKIININCTVFIWDVGETLIKTDNFKALQHFGYINTFKYMTHFFINNKTLSLNKFKNHMRNLFLNTLSKIPSPYGYEKLDYKIQSINGKPMPLLQRDFLLGKISSNDALNIINKWIKENPKYFENQNQKEIFKKSAELYFNQNIYISLQKKTRCFDLLRKSYENGYENIILSNFSKEGVELLKKYFNELFTYIKPNNMIFSCYEGILKPSAILFEKCKNIFPKEDSWIFIDDQPENLKAAQKLGIIGILPKDAKKTLIKFGII